MKFIRYQRTELTTLWLIADVDVGEADRSGYFWGCLWIVVKIQKAKKKFLERNFVYVVWNFVGIIETSNVKKNLQKFSKDTSFKKPKSSWQKRSWILNFQNGRLMAEFGEAVSYTLLFILSVINNILLVIVWYMIWLSCFKANFFWESLSGSPPKSYFYYFNCCKFEARTKFCCWLLKKQFWSRKQLIVTNFVSN